MGVSKSKILNDVMRTALKAGSHKDDQITLESPNKTEIRINYRKWLTSPKIFDIF